MTSPFEPDFNDPDAPLFQYAPPGYKYQENVESGGKLKVIKLDELFKKPKKKAKKSPKR